MPTEGNLFFYFEAPSVWKYKSWQAVRYADNLDTIM